MSVLKFHAERKSVLEVCSFCGLTCDFSEGLIPKAGHKGKGFNHLIKTKVIGFTNLILPVYENCKGNFGLSQDAEEYRCLNNGNRKGRQKTYFFFISGGV